MQTLLRHLQTDRLSRPTDGLWFRTLTAFTFHSNRIEGSRLSPDAVRECCLQAMNPGTPSPFPDSDAAEAFGHARCIGFVIDNALALLTPAFIKKIHKLLKNGTSDAAQGYAVGAYKRLPNTVGGIDTTPPRKVASEMKALLAEYSASDGKTLDDLLEFHVRFERIHPFQDGNGRVGRLILFKECLRHGIVPFIIEDRLKFCCYRGLAEWPHVPGYLRDTCLTAQDAYKKQPGFFGIAY